MRLALVHESLSALGGAERVLKEMQRTFPDAPLFTLSSVPHVARLFSPVATSFLQRLPEGVRRRRWALPLYPLAPETFDLSQYDVVLTSASAFAKGVVTRPGSLHVCYCHAPARFLWDLAPEVREEHTSGTIRRGFLSLTLHGLRVWDQAAARRVDTFIANSETTRARIMKYYRRDARVLYPPIDLARFRARGFSLKEPREFFLCVSRLSPYKGIDLVIETFNKLELPLVVAGAGRDFRRLKTLAGNTVKLYGFVSDTELSMLYARARAVIFPCDDDFGLVPIEAMASGTPVLALRRGGVTETVTEGVTGEFFDEPLEELLADCVRCFLEKEHTYAAEKLLERAEQFSAPRFRRELRALIERAWEERQRRGTTQGSRQPLGEAGVAPLAAHRGSPVLPVVLGRHGHVRMSLATS